MNFILGSKFFKTKIDVNFEIFKPNLSRQQPMLVDDPEKWSGFSADEHLAIRLVFQSSLSQLHVFLKSKRKFTHRLTRSTLLLQIRFVEVKFQIKCKYFVSCRKLLCSPSKPRKIPRKRMLHQSETDPRFTLLTDDTSTSFSQWLLSVCSD